MSLAARRKELPFSSAHRSRGRTTLVRLAVIHIHCIDWLEAWKFDNDKYKAYVLRQVVCHIWFIYLSYASKGRVFLSQWSVADINVSYIQRSCKPFWMRSGRLNIRITLITASIPAVKRRSHTTRCVVDSPGYTAAARAGMSPQVLL